MKKLSILLFLFSLISFISSAHANTEVLCKVKKTKAVLIRKKCKRGEVAVNISSLGALTSANLQNMQGPAGPQGQTGPKGDVGSQGPMGDSGVDGTLKVYGDGSAGSLVISSNANWNTIGPNISNNTQFENFTLNQAKTLSIPSGTVIRCTGVATINGIIFLQSGANGGIFSSTTGSTNENFFGIRPVPQGLGLSVAGSGEYGSSSLNRSGGNGGLGLMSPFHASQILRPGSRASSGGAGTISGVGGQGGGSITIIAQGGIVLGSQAQINANATQGINGGGGGAGGFIILASKTFVDVAGTINAKGGNGGNATTSMGNGGGGSGGIVHILSPSISTSGTIDVSPGQGAANEITITSANRMGGGGGGAVYLNGGDGATVLAGNTTSLSAEAGDSGVVIQSMFDPTSVL